MKWIAEQRAASLDDLAVVLGWNRGTFGHKGEAGNGPLTRAAVQRVVKRWTDAGLARRLYGFRDTPVLVVLTPEGARLMRAGSYREPALSSLEHVLAVNQVRLTIEAAGGARRWMGEHEARMLWGIRTSAPYNEHMADGFIVPTGEDEPKAGTALAVEVERHSKSKNRRKRIVQSNLQRFGGSWWACETNSVAQGIKQTVQDLGLGEADRRRAFVTIGYEQVPRSEFSLG